MTGFRSTWVEPLHEECLSTPIADERLAALTQASARASPIAGLDVVFDAQRTASRSTGAEGATSIRSQHACADVMYARGNVWNAGRAIADGTHCARSRLGFFLQVE